MPYSNNHILFRTNPVADEDVRPHLASPSLSRDRFSPRAVGGVNYVHFPHRSILSCVVELGDGSVIESGMIGKDGVFGLAQALNAEVSLRKVKVEER
jgi:hypothetical protein